MVSTRGISAWALALIMLVSTADAASSPPSLYDYKYDGKTTYCYWVDQGMEVQNLDFAYVQQQAQGNDCPLTLVISNSATAGQIVPLVNTEYAFTATLNLESNTFDLHSLPTYVPDPTTGRPVQIGHANVHTCSRTTVCDVFRTGSQRKITTQETSNFTGDSATFHQKMYFDTSGDYNVFAHIIIPPVNPKNASYHFITFMTTTVASTDTTTTSSGTSTGLIIGLVIGGVVLIVLVVLAIVFCKRKTPSNPGDDMFRSSGGGFMPTLTTKNHSKMDWHPESEFQWKDQYNSVHSQHSEYRQPPGLSASALAFHERVSSRQPKTASSSGSFRASSPKMGGYDGFGSPAAVVSQRAGNPQHMVTGGGNPYYTSPASGFNTHEADFRIPSAIIKSFESDNSMGTSLGFNADSHYTPYRVPGGNSYDRESELSSIHDDDEFDRYRANTGDPLTTLDEGRLSDISMATVDFTLHRPQPPRAVPYQRELDRSSMGTSDFGSTNRSTGEVFDFHGSKFHGKDDSHKPEMPMDPKNQVPRDGRTLSDGESYEF
ncbi:hypothetical protein Gpo141_00006576 [Globisporangium polare]